jgi:hypothetical protein
MLFIAVPVYNEEIGFSENFSSSHSLSHEATSDYANESKIEKWREGYDIVFPQRRHPTGEPWLERLISSASFTVVK